MRPLKAIRKFSKTLFHKRNIIVISERSTSHMSVSGKMQCLTLLMLVGIVGAGSYSTGQYMAARQVITEQDQTIKSVASTKVEKSFSYVVPSLSSSGFALSQVPAADSALAEKSYIIDSLDETELMSRIAFLEGQVNDLKATNQKIIATVKETAGEQIAGLEKVIARTGIAPELLHRHASRTASNVLEEAPVEEESAEEAGLLPWQSSGKGGPYIPENWDETVESFTEQLEVSVDKLTNLRKMVEALPLITPVKNSRKVSSFGRRVDPFHKRLAFHAGMDIVGKPSATVMAASGGKVTYAGRRGSYGNMVEISHGYGVTTRYAHLKRVVVKKGAYVAEGEPIGIQGTTGRSTGQHLHYEVRFNNRPVNPANFLAAGKEYVSQK